ncbi:MAG: glycosyltransferase family 4 protein, partial [Microbacteriaceae bacterium]|nr:glycosyltransferase family 4 protein [Microbacteriaceae bacterium]
GHVTEASDELDDAALLLLTTAFEGQGLVVVEALSHGCPVISYDVGYGPHDMLAGGGGALVPSGDVGALTAALARVLGDEALRERMGAEALAAAHRMDIAASMSALAAAVARALAGPTRR